MKRYIIQASIFLVSTIIIVSLEFIRLLQITNYNPSKEELIFQSTKNTTSIPSDTLSLLTWNIGYAGLGDDMDFFYDGGTKVRTSLSRTRQNLDSIKKWITQNSTDFIVLQEVDFNSKRTYYINQIQRLFNNKNKDLHVDPAYNYKVRYLPFPPTKPLGRIESGLLSVSRFQPIESKRIAYQATYGWPQKLWMLDRAFLVQKFETKSGKYLYIINTHNTAFDDGDIREKETLQLLKYSQTLYENGAYVVIAGDWNQSPEHESPTPSKQGKRTYTERSINRKHIPTNWNLFYHKKVPTNRSLNTMDPKTWHTSIIDFIVTSPNIQEINTQTVDLQFQFSDHNPVKFNFYLIK